MSRHQPNDRTAGAIEIAGAVRREARTSRQNQARYARLLADRYEWQPDRIAELLEIAPGTVARLLAADGAHRCVECAFGFHRSCMRELNFEGRHPCGCDCGWAA